MDSIREKFCQALRKWFEEEYAGDRTQLAAELGVSYEQICNILNGRRCGDETWRRKTAAYVGIPYEKMIGLDDLAVNGGNESENVAPSRSAELLPGWLRHFVPQLRYMDRAQREKLAAWLELEGLSPPSRGRMSPAGPMGGGRSGRSKTRRQTTEPARVHSLEAFRHRFPRLPNTRTAVAVHDGQVVLEVNQAMCELVGVARKDIIGTPVLDWLPPEDRESAARLISRPGVAPYEFRLLSRTGDALRVLVTMTRLASWRGRQVQVLSLRRAFGGALENPAAGNEANSLVLLGEAGCGRGVG